MSFLSEKCLQLREKLWKYTYYVKSCRKRLKFFILYTSGRNIFLQKYKCTNIWAYIHENDMLFCESTKGLSYTLKRNIVCKSTNAQIRRKLSTKIGNQSQRLQLLVKSLLHFSYLRIYWIFYNAYHHHHPKNRQSHHYHKHSTLLPAVQTSGGIFLGGPFLWLWRFSGAPF